MLMPRVEGRERDLADGIWRDALAATFTVSPRSGFTGTSHWTTSSCATDVLAAVIDFGCSGVGDPACDTVFRWTAPSEAARVQFREGLPGRRENLGRADAAGRCGRG